MANPMFDKLIAKKQAEGKSMSAVHKNAKGSVLEDLMEHLSGAGMDKIKGMKKVSVASDSKLGLSKGLEKAKEMISKDPMEAIENDEEMSDEGPNDAEAPGSQLDPESESHESDEDLHSQIAELKAQLAAMKG
jgi:hypothetical protein